MYYDISQVFTFRVNKAHLDFQENMIGKQSRVYSTSLWW